MKIKLAFFVQMKVVILGKKFISYFLSSFESVQGVRKGKNECWKIWQDMLNLCVHFALVKTHW